MPISKPVEIRFWNTVNKNSIDSCWISCNERIKLEDGKFIAMYKFSYLLHHPLILPIDFNTFELNHFKCSNKFCVNPNHLRLEQKNKNKLNDYKIN
jgi:hypothetical protein